MHIIKQGQWKEYVKFGKCICGCEFTLEQEEYENYVNEKTKYAEKEGLIFPVGREEAYLSKVECPCCRALVEMKTLELHHEYMVRDTDPYIYRGGK